MKTTKKILRKIKPGKEAPDFEVLNQDGKPVSKASLLGTPYVLFFYPQDNTPTCTIEACNLRDHFQEIMHLGYKLFGISMDSARRHQNFILKFDLPFDLLADVDRRMIDAFGVWGEKTTFGKTYDGIHRTTFLIDAKGMVSHRIDDVKSKDHAAQILERIQQTK